MCVFFKSGQGGQAQGSSPVPICTQTKRTAFEQRLHGEVEVGVAIPQLHTRTYCTCTAHAKHVYMYVY